MNDVEDKGIKQTVENLRKLFPFRFIVAREEKAPTTGHLHWHIYVHFVDRVYFHGVKNILLTAHIDECRGSEIDNYKNNRLKLSNLISKQLKF